MNTTHFEMEMIFFFACFFDCLFEKFVKVGGIGQRPISTDCETTVVGNCLITFLIVVTKFLVRSNLGEERLILARGWIGHVTDLGEF